MTAQEGAFNVSQARRRNVGFALELAQFLLDLFHGGLGLGHLLPIPVFFSVVQHVLPDFAVVVDVEGADTFHPDLAVVVLFKEAQPFFGHDPHDFQAADPADRPPGLNLVLQDPEINGLQFHADGGKPRVAEQLEDRDPVHVVEQPLEQEQTNQSRINQGKRDQLIDESYVGCLSLGPVFEDEVRGVDLMADFADEEADEILAEDLRHSV